MLKRRLFQKPVMPGRGKAKGIISFKSFLLAGNFVL
jgi:hypothetical protein